MHGIRRTDVRRGSVPPPQELCKSPEEKALLEAQNGLLQFDEVLRLVDEAVAAKARFALRPSTLQALNRIAIQNVHSGAGVYRNGPVYIEGTNHQPPPAEDVPRLVEGLCDYVNGNWHRSPVHLAAFIMWRLNWIHPFWEGNGRTSRAVSYLVLCIRLGYRLPGTLTVPEQIVANREPYYRALDAADAAEQLGKQDLSAMEKILDHMLATQLAGVLKSARDSNPPPGSAPSLSA